MLKLIVGGRWFTSLHIAIYHTLYVAPIVYLDLDVL